MTDGRPSTRRPILFLGVGGSVHPYETHHPDKHGQHNSALADDELSQLWFNATHARQLLALAQRTDLELVWASSWEHQANEIIAPRVGLPPLPVVEFGLRIRCSWKWNAVALYAAGRPLAWLDDEFAAWQNTRGAFNTTRQGIDTLLVHVDPAVGLTDRAISEIEFWAMTRPFSSDPGTDVGNG